MDPGRPSASTFTLHLSIPRHARYVALLRRLAACIFDDLGVPRQDAQDIQLALTEACANAVRHASGTQSYTVGLTVDATGCQVDVMDLGPAFVPAGEATASADDETGRGLQLMQALVDDLQFERQEHTTCVILHKRWDGVGLLTPAAGPPL